MLRFVSILPAQRSLRGCRYWSGVYGRGRQAPKTRVTRRGGLDVVDSDGRTADRDSTRAARAEPRVDSDGATAVANDPPVADERLDSFISYARRPSDREFVDWLSRELANRGKQIWMDRSHIEPAADWRARITRGIELANAFIFVISPASAASAECMAELSAAVAQHKRIIPVVLSNVPPEDLPASVTAPNWIDFQSPVDRAAKVDRLIEALDADLKWRDASTRLAARAREWQASDRDPSFLLRGADLKAAETWSESKGSHQERPTNQQYAYLAASRRASDLRERASFLVRVTRPVSLYFLGGVLILVPSGLVALIVIKVSAAFGQDYLSLHQETFVHCLYVAEFFIYVLFIRRKYRLSRYGYFSLDGRPCGAMKYAMRWLLIPAGLVMTPLTRCFAEARLTWVDQKTGTELVSIKRDGSRRDGKVPPAAAVKRTWRSRAVRVIAAKVPGGFYHLVGVKTPVAVTGPPPARTELTGAPDELTASARSDHAGRHADAAVPHRKLTRRHVALVSGALVLAVAAAGAGLWLDHSSPSASAAPLKVNTCARTASGSVIPVLLGSITTGAIENDFVDVAFSPDCQVVAAGGNGIVQERDLVTGRRIATMPAAPGNAVDIDAFTPNGEALAVAGGNGYTTLWNAATGRLEARFPSDPSGGTYCLVISPDGTEIFTGGSTGVVRIWGVNTRRSIGAIPTGVAVGAMALSPNGKLLAVGGYDGIVRIFDTASHAQVATLRGDEGHIWSMAFSPDGSTLAAGSNVLQWWDVATSKLVADENSPGGDVTDVAFSPDGKVVAAGGNEMVGLWDAHTRRLVITVGLAIDGAADSGSYPNGMSFSRYGAVLAIGYRGTLQFWNVARI